MTWWEKERVMFAREDVASDGGRSRSPRLGGMQIFMQMMRDKTIALDVDAFDTIAIVKALIQEKEGIPTHRQCIRQPGINYKDFRGGMEDGSTLSDYHVKAGMTLVMASFCVISVRTISGETIDIDVSPLTDTIDHVKAEIQDKVGIPFHQQSLVFNGEVVKGGSRTLSLCEIWDGAELTVVRVADKDEDQYLRLAWERWL